MLLILGLALLSLIPAGAYAIAKRKWGSEWTVFDKVPSPAGGAYRGGWVWLPRNPGAPFLVKVASVWSLGLMVPALVSLPLIALGVANEADKGGIGPAGVFGPTGFLLAVMIFAAGIKLHRRSNSSRRFARGVAAWAVIHNIAVVYAVMASSTNDDRGPWNDFDVHNMGWVALVYATLSFGHAFTLLASTQDHERADNDTSARQEPVARELDAV